MVGSRGGGTGGWLRSHRLRAHRQVVDPEDWEPTASPTPFVRVFGSAADDSAYTIATARNGDVVLAATVLDTIDLGNGTLPASGETMALGRFTPDGQHRWSKSISSSAGTFTMRSIVMRNERLSLGGHFNGTAMIDAAPVTAVNGQAYLVLEANATGALVPVTYAGSTAGRNAQGYGISEASDGRRAIGGIYGAQVQIDPVRQLPAPDMDDGWLLVLDASGAPRDVFTFTAPNVNFVRALAFDGLGNLCVVGDFSGTVTSSGRATSTATDGSFVGVMDATGALVSLATFDGTFNTRALQVAGLAGGGFVFAGRGTGTVRFGTQMVTTTLQEMIVTRLDARGDPIWMRAYGSSGGTTSPAIAVAPNGQIVLAFTYFGQLSIAGQMFTEIGAGDLAVVTLDADGTPLRAFRDGGAAFEGPSAVTVDYASGDIVVSGSFDGTGTVGGMNTSSQGPDIFLLRLSLL